MTFILDYGTRTVRQCLEDGIIAMSREILAPTYAATGDAATWAENAPRNVSVADDYLVDDVEDFLQYVWNDGAEYLYQVTGLHAIEDGHAGGLLFLPDEERHLVPTCNCVHCN